VHQSCSLPDRNPRTKDSANSLPWCSLEFYQTWHSVGNMVRAKPTETGCTEPRVRYRTCFPAYVPRRSTMVLAGASIRSASLASGSC